ncbi:hypothetical protein [Euzebya sp.]|uniref:hypothetical protein n=1 Tax=Euzebya sp. TaxID=1971409 RepID=UPI00351172A9
MRTPLPLLALLLVLALAGAGCAGSATDVGAGGDPTDPVTEPDSEAPIPVEPDGGIGDTPSDADTPIPVEPDGGIGTSSSPVGSDTPIPVEPDGGIGDDGSGAGDPETAPPFGVSAEADDVVAEPYTSCWTTEESGVCSDGFPGSREELTADARIVVTYPEGELGAEISPPLTDDDSAGVDRLPLPVTPENPGIWIVDVSGLEPGQHTLWLTWSGAQGDSSAAIDLTVE